MTRKKITAVLAVGMLAFSANVFATEMGPGLGSTIIGDKPGKVNDILKGFLNGIAFNQLFAISFGTLVYVEEEKPDSVRDFVEQNMDALAADISKGKGERLNTLCDMLGVPADYFAPVLKQNFTKIYPTSDVTAKQVTDTIRSLIPDEK